MYTLVPVIYITRNKIHPLFATVIKINIPFHYQVQNIVGEQLKEAMVAQPQSVPVSHSKDLDDKAIKE